MSLHGSGSSDKPRLIRTLRARFRQVTGRDYRIDLDALDATSLVEFSRFIDDMETEAERRARKARNNPWRPL